MQMICRKLIVALVLTSVVSVPLTWWSANAETSDRSDGSCNVASTAHEGNPAERQDSGEPDVGDTGRQVTTAGVSTWSQDPQVSWWQRLHWNGGVLAPYICWIPTGSDD